MADSAVSFVLGRLAEFAVKEAGVLKEVGNDVMLLKDKLEWLQTFIRDADRRRRRGGNAYMDVWVQQTREVALEVEDVLDEFTLRVVVGRRQGLAAWSQWAKLLCACTTEISVRHGLSARIGMIKARLQQISDHTSTYIAEYAPSATLSSPSTTTYYKRTGWYQLQSSLGWDEEEQVVGLEHESQVLERSLLQGDEGRTIISVVGDSGVGKSTLVQVVYDSPAVRAHFHVRVRISVPAHARDTDILNFIYKGLCHENNQLKATAMPGGRVESAIQEHLQGKRYLVVIDGYFNPTQCNTVLQDLPDSRSGSRVVFIARGVDDVEVEAPYAGQGVVVLKVRPLNRAESYTLFHRAALGSSHQFRRKVLGDKSIEQCEEQMEAACGGLLEVTQGLALPTLLLGRLLRRKEFPVQWRDVLRGLVSIEESARAEGVLALSFDDLPDHLKSCFLYLAMMPGNLVISARRLVRLWAAEGLLKARQGEMMEDVGLGYLKDLVSRGIIRLVHTDSLTSGRKLHVAIHGWLHAMARLEAQQATFLEVYTNMGVPSPVVVRQLYLQSYMLSYTEGTWFPKLRSIMCDFAEIKHPSNIVPPPPADTWWPNRNKRSAIDLRYTALHLLSRSRFLRVIDLRGLRVTQVPPEIGRLVHLRYLGIRSSNLAKLPSSITGLINLQTLDIKRSKVVKVPQALWRLPALRHVIAHNLQFPKSTIGASNNLQTLNGLVCSHPWDNNISPLQDMVHLRYLHISGLTDQHWDGLADAFKKLESLLYLHLAGNNIPYKLFTGFTLQRLQILELRGRIHADDADMQERYKLPNLTRLLLKLSMVNQGFIDKIGELPSLRELVLYQGSYDGEQLIFSAPSFCNLTDLVLANLQEMLVNISPMSIPRIKRIVLSGCSKMKIKLVGQQGSEGVIDNLKESVLCNMCEDISIEPTNSSSSKQIDQKITEQSDQMNGLGA